MPFHYKIDVLAALKDAGWSTYRISKEKLFNSDTVQRFRTGKMVAWPQIEKLCTILQMDVGDLVTFQPVKLPND